ncbi:hypothetical protein [Falsirhodobacter deserti]|uniref:hypothetical protein n=1 Tax=Falsirhodobacter deserti TaxID=1365611 RepID=UPI000FE43767|nr:hypothetical protein [Falsirhodobacter deserti]
MLQLDFTDDGMQRSGFSGPVPERGACIQDAGRCDIALAACAWDEQSALRRIMELEGGRLMGVAQRILQRPAAAA